MNGSPNLPFFLGCPVWNCQEWEGTVYPTGARKSKWLYHYTRMFNTVEGNSTFYGLPPQKTVLRWADESANGFRFALKVPRSISHDARLVNCRKQLDDFLEIVDVLHQADRLGPSFLQLSPSFGPDSIDVLRRFLKHLPQEYPWAVEVRHLAWFDQSDNENRLNDLLRECGCDKVLFDSRPLYQAEPDTVTEEAAQRRKPKTPVRQTVTGSRPLLRFIGRDHIEMAARFIEQWVPIFSHWIAQGHKPYIFTHCPNDRFAPELARYLWRLFCSHEQESGSRGFPIDSLPSEPTFQSQPRLFE